MLYVRNNMTKNLILKLHIDSQCILEDMSNYNNINKKLNFKPTSFGLCVVDPRDVFKTTTDKWWKFVKVVNTNKHSSLTRNGHACKNTNEAWFMVFSSMFLLHFYDRQHYKILGTHNIRKNCAFNVFQHVLSW